jgi:hypothetical protein
MKTPLVLLLLSLASSGWSQEPGPTTDKAEALMRILSAEQFFRAGIGSALRKGVTDGHTTQAQFDCVMSADYGFVSRAYVEVARRSLTAGETDDALAFFESSAGQITLAMAWEMARKAFPGIEGGPDPEDAAREPTAEEQQRMERYISSGLADKVNAVTGEPKLGGTELQLQRIISECHQQP